MQVLEINDLMRLARRRVRHTFFDYADSGAFSELTYRSNEVDLGAIELHVGKKLCGQWLETKIAGFPAALPLVLALVDILGTQRAYGEILTAHPGQAGACA